MKKKTEPETKPTNDPVGLSGRLKLELHGPDGKLKEAKEVENLVTTVGKNDLADQVLASPAQGKPTHMAVGTGAVAPAAGDTALGTEVARVALTSKTRSTNVITYVATFPAGTGTAALTEAGVFTASSSGDLWQRVTFGTLTKNAGDSLTITWTLTVG